MVGQNPQKVWNRILIGARALVAADRLITRDRGGYRTYLPGLALAWPGPE